MPKFIHRLSNIDREAKTALCSYCGETTIKVPRTRSPVCRESINAYRRGFLAGARGKKCAICDVECLTHWDHDHSTGKFRGWLCKNCNMGLGVFQDNIHTLQNAIRYLKESRSTD